MVEKEVIGKVRKFIKELKKKKIKISKVIIYGSRVTGKAHKYSDIDIAIVSPDFGKDKYKEAVKLFEIASTVDSRIEPIPLSIESYEKDTWIPLIYEIRVNGFELQTVS